MRISQEQFDPRFLKPQFSNQQNNFLFFNKIFEVGQNDMLQLKAFPAFPVSSPLVTLPHLGFRRRLGEGSAKRIIFPADYRGIVRRLLSYLIFVPSSVGSHK